MKFRLLGTAAALLLLSACSNYQYKSFVGNLDDPALRVLDLSDGVTDAPVIYFETMQYRDLGIPFHRLLLAVRVDGRPLPYAGKYSILDYFGYQAIRLTPGSHSLEWCWVSMNKLGTGGGKCGFGAPDLKLEAGKHYLATWSSSTAMIGVSGSEQMQISVTSYVLDRDTRERVYP